MEAAGGGGEDVEAVAVAVAGSGQVLLRGGWLVGGGERCPVSCILLAECEARRVR